MKIKSLSAFRNPKEDFQYYRHWVNELEKLNQTSYEQIEIPTALGKTIVWGINSKDDSKDSLVIFPGFRTSILFWDFDNALDALRKTHRIFLVDANGQPNLSDGKTPYIRSNDYGHWAAEVITQLGMQKASVAGCSFGSLICLKLSMVAAHMIDKIILLNPGCLQTFSISFDNIYYNLLPIFSPGEKSVRTFLDNAIFCKPNHRISETAEQMLVDYEVFVLKRFIDKAQKPYAMGKKELSKVSNDVYMILGDRDILFPYKKSIDVAEKYIPKLKNIFVLKDTGHGIETSKEAIGIMKDILGN